MLRILLTVTGLVLLGSGALAQKSSSILPVPGVKHAGTYHVATGTWTRGQPSLARRAADVIYDNTCAGTWYTAREQQTFHDDGRIPSHTSPVVTQTPTPGSNWPVVSFPGTDDSYMVGWYEFAYCTGVAAPVTALTAFYECYTSCSDATLISPTMALSVPGLPGSPNPGVGIGCWTVSIDLVGTTNNFQMMGDCDGVWDGTPLLDNFGYMYMQSTPDPAALSGPVLAGDPDGLLLDGPGSSGCCVGCNTIFLQTGFPVGVPGTCTQGSGLNCQDRFEIDDHLGGYTFVYNNCFWFGGYSPVAPHADIYMEIATGPWHPHPGIPYCFGNTAAGNPCPCMNDNPGLQNGCANGTYPTGANLSGYGVPSLSNDTLILQGTFGQPNNSSMFFQAVSHLDYAGLFLGDGIRCAGGNVKRLKVQLNDASGDANTMPVMISARSALLGDVLQAGDTRYYQWWFRDIPGLCGNESNTSNGYMVFWMP